MKYSAEQYNQIFKVLPTEIRDIVASQLTSEKLWAIGAKHRLHIDKVSILHDMALDVMMGIIGTKNFVKEIINEVEKNPLEAGAIARDIDDEIFKPIRNTMQKLYGEGAPNKPSSSLVEFHEKEDELTEMHRDTILEEIENPVPVSAKKILIETIDKENKKENTSTQEKPKETSKQIEEYKEELRAPNEELLKITIPSEIKTRILDNIATLSLSKSMVMPKIGESIIPKTSEPSIERNTTPPVQKTEQEKPQEPATTKADPYREPLH